MRSSGLFVVLAAYAVGCNALAGLERMTFERAGETGGSATTSASVGGTAGAGAGGAGAGGDGPMMCDPEACPGERTDCVDIVCVNGECGTVTKTRGTSCGGPGGAVYFCDGADNCVECLDDVHCLSQVCQASLCYEAACDNGLLDTNETDVDCGDACGPCDDGLDCNNPSDCSSHRCDNGTCTECNVAADCSPTEYCDDPLGGDCQPKLGNGSFCTSDAGCISGCCNFVCNTC